MGIYRQGAAAFLLSLLFSAQAFQPGAFGGELPSFTGDSASEIALAQPEAVDLSGQALARIEAYFSALVGVGARSGMVAMVARRGQIAYAVATGLRDIENSEPMTLDTRFRIASMTKPITSLAVMMLVEEGKLALDDPVSRSLPEFSKMRVATATEYAADGSIASRPAARQITVRQLLTHTAGLGYVLDFGTDIGRDFRVANLHFGPPSLAEMTRRLATHPLYFEPGERWKYSFATDVLGRLVEVASGQPFDAFVEERILGPLGMDDTDFIIEQSYSAGRADRLAVVYRFGEDGGLLAVTPDDVSLGGMEAADGKAKSREIQRWPSGGAGLISTAGDYMRFLLMLANGGELDGRRLVSPATIQRMTRNHLTPDMVDGSFLGDPASIGFGLGFYVITDAAQRETPSSDGEYGWGGYFGTSFFVAPAEDNLIAIMMTQRLQKDDDPARQLKGDFKSLVYGAITD